MNSKAFRRNPGLKPKSTSSTFISLHFNKSDEDQLEISYKKGNPEISNFYTKKETFLAEDKKNIPISDSPIKVSKISVSEEEIKSSQCSVEADKFDRLGQNEEFNPQSNDCELKLSPAIEATELMHCDSLNPLVKKELKSETLDSKSKERMKFSSASLADSKAMDVLDANNWDKANVDDSQNSLRAFLSFSQFYSILRNSTVLMKWSQNSVKVHLLIVVLACIFAPIPSWLSGFLVGILLSCSLVYWLHKPLKNKKNFYDLNFASSQASDFQNDSSILKGWMNELPSFIGYSPEQYHVSCTRSVYVRLEGSYLRFSFPQKNIPKRAMFNEPRHEMQFVHQQHYDITGATVELLPQGLSNKRLWNKKYPICLRIPNGKGALLTKSFHPENPNRKWMPRMNEENEIVIYLFSRTDCDKSLWFSRFLKASTQKVEGIHSTGRMTEGKRNLSLDFASLSLDDPIEDDFVKISLTQQQKFEMYMSALLFPLHTEREKKEAKSSLTWLNGLIGRLFFDFLVQDVWAQHVSAKIQKKLNAIKLPFFLSELSVKDINLGSALPKIHSASDPSLDERGLWIDVDISYNGSFHMTLETKLNLDRFKDEEQAKLTVCNSDEDSLESSSDEECLIPESSEDSSQKESSSGKKFLKLMDKLAQSSYFQHAAKNKYVKRAMGDLSNTPLILMVEVQWLTGTLAVNVPPWPTDRLWYGFRTNPSLSITARPKLGQHVVTFTHITEWIEKKLALEFQKVLVMPNMDDLILPMMQPSQDIS